ncbi:bifunctional RecB family nuclease/DEAD/DEAH box helicase [Nocardia sp. BMG111209]|uniref:bifunctional RecB family nuclease/DEAD/DEAH box helicase n=1 Tax=Nocardia sp. BMG111209 TaxID=1160137 RepID=UPI00036D6871|nr:bifunctional RecB family nuclease/DEAD/DEAH box helicase [Nocardia sp. BMG111209]
MLFGDRVVCTAGDLAAAARCEFALLRALDAEVGPMSSGPAAVPEPVETRELSDSELFGAGHTGDADRVVRIAPPAAGSPGDSVAARLEAHRRTLDALHAGADVVLGATFLDGDFVATATALVRLPATGPHQMHPPLPTPGNESSLDTPPLVPGPVVPRIDGGGSSGTVAGRSEAHSFGDFPAISFPESFVPEPAASVPGDPAHTRSVPGEYAGTATGPFTTAELERGTAARYFAGRPAEFRIREFDTDRPDGDVSPQRSAHAAGTDVAGTDVASANVASANVASANVASANVASANATGADVASANATGADVAGADVAGAGIARAGIASAGIARAGIARAGIAGAHGASTDRAGAVEVGADSTGADGVGAVGAGAVGAGADRAGAQGAGADRVSAGADAAGADESGGRPEREAMHPAQGMFEVPGIPAEVEPGRVDGQWTMSMLVGDGYAVDRIIDGDALGATGSGVVDQPVEEPVADGDAHDGDRYLLYAAVRGDGEVAALIELAACAEMLRRNGFVADPEVRLLLPDGTRRARSLDRAVTVYAARRRRLERILDEKQNELLPVQWGDRRYLACGRCPTCTAELVAGRDLLLVAGMRPAVRAQLREAGITTVERLAAADGAVTRVAAHTFGALRRQAELQVQRERTGRAAYTVTDANALGTLPDPSPGDVFLAVAGSSAGVGVLAAHTPEGGSPALLFHPFDVYDDPATLPQFLIDRCQRHPGLRIYHYRSDARRLLTELSARYGADEDATAELLGLLVDLYPVVRTATIIGLRSYDLPAVVAHLAAETGPAGEDPESDCARLRWLRGRLGELAAAHHIPLGHAPITTVAEPVPAVEAALREFALSTGPDDGTDLGADRAPGRRAAALMAAVLGYHRRERQPLHWAHADRLHGPVDEWDDAPGVLVSDWGSVDTKWHSTGRPPMRRYLTLTGRLGSGSTPSPGSPVLTLYDRPAPGMRAEPGRRAVARATILGCALDGNFDDAVRIEEQLPGDCDPYDELPVAIVPGPPGRDENIAATLEFTAHQLLVSLPGIPATAAFDLLCRRPPRRRSGAALPEVFGDHAAAITAAVLDLDDSYLAVQGPSGTGRTDTAARVIERLVTRHKWRIGVVAQTHSTVEQLLDALVRVGVLPELVAKSEAQAVAAEWLAIAPARYARFLDNAVNGCVIGGLPGDFADDERVAAGALDLLVIADAGGFPLADTLAVAAGARNLLLLGDPAPLSGNGIHPEPVQESALGRLVGDAPTLPGEFGYFLDRTWRMHPRLCGPVSRLRYGNRLRSNEIVTLARDLAGVPAGVRTAAVQHHGNSTESAEEAREIVRRVRALLGLPWRQGAVTRRLHPHDILVITPYHAQVARIRTMLSRARIEDVLVGTADRFRGREAAVVLISMTTSSPADAPHGIDALLSRHWLTGAVSRAMWTAVIVHSPLLAEYLPETPEQLDDLAAFLELSAG